MTKNIFYKFTNFILIHLIILLHFNCNEPNDQSEKFGEMTQQYVIARLYIIPTLDFNQFCPPTDLIPILDPGNHSIYLEEGNTYIFDNRARLNMVNYTRDSSRFFTFKFQENPGQEVKMISPYCGLSPDSYSADNDSGNEGQLEDVYIDLESPIRGIRTGFFTKFLAIKGSGMLNFTTPITFDPPR